MRRAVITVCFLPQASTLWMAYHEELDPQTGPK